MTGDAGLMHRCLEAWGVLEVMPGFWVPGDGHVLIVAFETRLRAATFFRFVF
jgi:hypothetical protein